MTNMPCAVTKSFSKYFTGYLPILKLKTDNYANANKAGSGANKAGSGATVRYAQPMPHYFGLRIKT